jgi:hypothetical protein
MTVMRDEMNWPMAEIIKKESDQNLRGIGCVRKRRDMNHSTRLTGYR